MTGRISRIFIRLSNACPALVYPDIQYEKHLSDWFVQEFKPSPD